MKKVLLIVFALGFAVQGWGQETFKKKYTICQDTIKLNGGDYVFLKKDSLVKYSDLPEKEIVKLGDKFTITNEVSLGNEKAKVSREITVNQAFLDTLKIEQPQNVVLNSSMSAYVSFENDKVYINPYLKKDVEGKYTRVPVYYYELKNRQTIRLFFKEWNISALTIPIKYRFKGENGLAEEFTTAINGNVFIGYSFGKTSFFHREKVGNKSNTWKVTGGLLLGASTVTLNSSNTSQAVAPLDKDTEITKGIGSIGVGLTYSFNKINVGAFYGYDYAIGDGAEKWNYNKKPWLGVAIGYSILNF